MATSFGWTTAAVTSNGGSWKIDSAQTNTVVFDTNLDGTLHPNNLFKFSVDDCGADGLYTLDGVESTGDQNTFTVLAADDTASVVVTNSKNIQNDEVVCIRMKLWFIDATGLLEKASKDFTFDPVTLDEETALTHAPGATGSLSENGDGAQTTAAVASQAADLRTGSVAATPPTDATYGAPTAWTVTGNSLYWYQITDVSKTGGGTLTETDWTGCAVGSGTATCSKVIPLTFFNSDSTMTATITYDWWAYDPSARRGLTGELPKPDGSVTRMLQDSTSVVVKQDESGQLYGSGTVERVIELVGVASDYQEEAVVSGIGAGTAAVISAASVAAFGIIVAALTVCFMNRKQRNTVVIGKSLEESGRTIDIDGSARTFDGSNRQVAEHMA